MIWVALIVKQDTSAIVGEHSDVVFVEAEDRIEAVKAINNNQWPEPWGRKDASKCLTVKIFKISEVPSSLLVGQPIQREKLSQDLHKLYCKSADQIKIESKLRVRRKRR